MKKERKLKNINNFTGMMAEIAENDQDSSLEGKDENLHCFCGVDEKNQLFIIQTLNPETVNPLIEEIVLEYLSEEDNYNMSPGIYDVWLSIKSWTDWTDCGYEYDSELDIKIVRKMMLSSRSC